MTRRPWRTKQPSSKVTLAPINVPGHCLSVDQLESASFGFISQMKGALTFKQYKFATQSLLTTTVDYPMFICSKQIWQSKLWRPSKLLKSLLQHMRSMSNIIMLTMVDSPINIILRSQRTLPKWCCRGTSTRSHKDNPFRCKVLMA